MRTIELSASGDRATAAALHAELSQAVHDGPVWIDGGKVVRIGQAMLQLLLSAKLTADRLGNEFRLTASPAMSDTLALTGLSHIVTESPLT